MTRKPPRIKMLKPRLSTMRPRFGAATREEKEAQRFKDRDASHEFRAWYKTKRWRDLRERVLLRDLYTCAMCAKVCSGAYPDPGSAVVDHRQPHRGDETLFWEEANCQCMCKGCHDGEKQRTERDERRRDPSL